MNLWLLRACFALVHAANFYSVGIVVQPKHPDPREDPKCRSLKGVPIKYPLVARIPNWGIYFLDPPGGLGTSCQVFLEDQRSPCPVFYDCETDGPCGSFLKLGVPYCGVLKIRILLFRVLY